MGAPKLLFGIVMHCLAKESWNIHIIVLCKCRAGTLSEKAIILICARLVGGSRMVGVCLESQINQRSSLCVAVREQKRLLNVLIARQELRHGRIIQEVLCGCYCGFKPHYLSPLVLTQRLKKQETAADMSTGWNKGTVKDEDAVRVCAWNDITQRCYNADTNLVGQRIKVKVVFLRDNTVLDTPNMRNWYESDGLEHEALG